MTVVSLEKSDEPKIFHTELFFGEKSGAKTGAKTGAKSGAK